VKWIISFLLVTIFIGQSLGFGYFDSIHSGTIMPGISPTSTALGSLRALGINEPVSMFLNPAQTANLSSTVQIAGASIHWKEKVIESDIDKTVRTFITNGNGSLAFVQPVGEITLGAGLAKIGEFGYEGIHTLYDDPEDPELGVVVLYADGAQWESVGQISTSITEEFSVGFSAGIRMVQADYEYIFNSHQFLLPDSSAAWSIEDKAFAWHGGLAYNGDMFQSAASYSSKTDYMYDILAFGSSALAPHLNNTIVGFEAQVSSLADDSKFLGNVFIKTSFTKEVLALISVSFDDNRVANRAGLGFGLGIEATYDKFALSGGILNRFRSRKNTAFPAEASDRVDDSFTALSLGFSYFL